MMIENMMINGKIILILEKVIPIVKVVNLMITVKVNMVKIMNLEKEITDQKDQNLIKGMMVPKDRNRKGDDGPKGSE